MRIRTVFDARPPNSARFERQILLLAHSWAASARTSPLEVFAVGEPSDGILARLAELGVELRVSDPHPLDRISRRANKLLALREPSDEPVLLVDNDVCFLASVSTLDGREVRASRASLGAIDDGRWEHIAQATGLTPLPGQWIPPKEKAKAREEGRAPHAESTLYFNTGVIWLRQPAALERIWGKNLRTIAAAFEGHPLDAFKVRGDDQIGFATAIAGYGGFDPLPPVYNYRPVFFRLGDSAQAKILHLTKFRDQNQPTPSTMLINWWDRRIVRRLRGQEQLLDEALAVRDRVLRLIEEAGLDEFF